MSGVVLVSPPGRVETDCVVHALLAAGIKATAVSDVAHAVAAVALAFPGIPLQDTILRLRRQTSRLPLLLVAADVDEESVALARSSEAVGLVAWHASTQMLIDAVQALLHGTCALPSVASRRVDVNPLGQLTDREHEIVALLSQGRRNDEIATELGISYHTVRTHVQHVLTKLDVPHRHAAAVMAQRNASVPRQATVGDAVATSSGEET